MRKQPAPQDGYEKRDVSVRGVAWFALGLTISLAVIGLGGVGFFRLLAHAHPSSDAVSRIALRPNMIAPAPRLQSDPASDLAKFEATENARLNSYGWVDKNAGIIRLPIERAMDLIAQRGLPTRGPGTQDASGVTAIQMQEQKAAATK